jgi:hypothetical protein
VPSVGVQGAAAVDDARAVVGERAVEEVEGALGVVGVVAEVGPEGEGDRAERGVLGGSGGAQDGDEVPLGRVAAFVVRAPSGEREASAALAKSRRPTASVEEACLRRSVISRI